MRGTTWIAVGFVGLFALAALPYVTTGQQPAPTGAQELPLNQQTPEALPAEKPEPKPSEEDPSGPERLPVPSEEPPATTGEQSPKQPETPERPERAGPRPGRGPRPGSEPLRDPTQVRPELRPLLDPINGPGGPTPVLPTIRLRGRVAAPNSGAIGILEVDGRLYFIREGSQINTGIAGKGNLTLLIKRLTQDELQVTIEPLGQTFFVR